MFDLDMSKMLLVMVVALVVVGPKELPQVLRALGRAVSRLRSLQFSMQRATVEFMAEADLDSIGKDLSSLEKGVRSSIGSNPATAMRGSLSALSGVTAARGSKIEVPCYTSPEMKAYLSPASESLPDSESHNTLKSGVPVAAHHAVIPSTMHLEPTADVSQTSGR